MLTQEYFNVTFTKQLRVLGNVSVRVTLKSGTHYWVLRVHEAKNAYVVLEVYPDKGKAKFGEPQDQVVVPYDSIAELLLTRQVPDDNKVYGFKQN